MRARYFVLRTGRGSYIETERLEREADELEARS